METDTDRLAYMETFGETIRTNRGDFLAIFDNEGAEIEIDNARVRSTAPQITARSYDLTRCEIDKRGALLDICGAAYAVRELVPDGTGITVVILDEV